MKDSKKYKTGMSVKWTAVLAALIVFNILILFNSLIPIMRSLPDEIGSVALAAKLVGYDWNYVLTHPEMYYGSGNVFFAYPIFYFVKDPLVVYQCLIGVGAFLHAIPAYIAGAILIEICGENISKIEIVVISMISAFITPTRSSNIDNEPMLVLLCWCIVYLIMILQRIAIKKKQILYSAVLGQVLAFAYFWHTRAIMYTLIMLLLIVVYYIYTKKMLINVISFTAALSINYIIVGIITKNIRKSIFTSHEIPDNVVANSPQALVNSVSNGGNLLFSNKGFVGFLDLFLSNLWVIYIFSGGIFCLTIYFFIKEIQRLNVLRFKDLSLISSIDLIFPFMYCMLGFIATLIGLCITWIDTGINVHTMQSNLSRGHFYLRYYGNFLAPLFLFTIIILHQNRYCLEKRTLYKMLVTVVFIVDYCLLSFVGVALKSYTTFLDWFYYFAPFSLQLNKWPDSIQNINYFIISTLIVSFVFILILYLVQKKFGIIILLFFLIWEYGYGVFMFDRPYAMSENYYLSVNSIYELNRADNTIFDDCDTLFYHNEVYGPGYIVQFMMPNKKVITNMDLLDSTEDNIIFSAEVLNKTIVDSAYSYVRLDDNEYLYVNNEKRKAKLDQLGLKVIKVE